ncbi:VOC family protein [Taibaiella koreensis]|uniref:VOC family protein n=1 Tax=Taibaiella koreensis TaxID=1268548 RepID=UPI000E59C59F|nr:VOC family protein [Taibaiella koreensis]
MNLNQVTLPSLDLQQSVSFYQQLGMRLIVDALPRYARFECPDGQSTFSLHLVDRLPDGEGIWIYLECEDLDNRVAALVAGGLKMETMPEDKPWFWREARLRDPDGNQLILYYAGENRLNPPWRI